MVVAHSNAVRSGASRTVPRLYWQRHQTRAEGVSFGYANLLSRIDQAVEHDEESDLVLQCSPVDMFRPIAGKRHVLFTMWESRDVPKSDIAKLQQADYLIVPSTFCHDVFRPHTKAPIYIVPLGIDPALTFRRRELPTNGPFVWYWTASVDPRKSWQIVAGMWQTFFAGRTDMLLYYKTSAANTHEIHRKGNVVIDCRTLPPDEFYALYYNAHGFLFPSMAEGFGFCGAEAMASGLPVVGTSCTGHADFFHAHTGYVVPHDPIRVAALADSESAAEDGKYEVCVPYGGEMAVQMERVMADYRAAQKKAKRASDLIHSRYTWPHFTRNLQSTLSRILA